MHAGNARYFPHFCGNYNKRTGQNHLNGGPKLPQVKISTPLEIAVEKKQTKTQTTMMMDATRSYVDQVLVYWDIGNIESIIWRLWDLAGAIGEKIAAVGDI